jgi:hypothetical protein
MARKTIASLENELRCALSNQEDFRQKLIAEQGKHRQTREAHKEELKQYVPMTEVAYLRHFLMGMLANEQKPSREVIMDKVHIRKESEPFEPTRRYVELTAILERLDRLANSRHTSSLDLYHPAY